MDDALGVGRLQRRGGLTEDARDPQQGQALLPSQQLEQVLALEAGDEGDVQADRMAALPYSEDSTKGAVLRARRWAAGREIAIQGRFGIQSFFDSEIRKSLIPTLPMVGVEADFRGFLGPVLSIRLDVMAGSIQHEPFADVSARVTEVHGGVGTFLSPRIPGARSLRPFVGARVGLIWLHRSFEAPLIQAPQDYVMAAPGLAGGLVVAPDRRFRIGLEARTHLMLYVDGDEQQALGYFEGILSMGIAL